MANLALPGNPRYQPKELQPVFGYDNLYRTLAEVEFATMQTLAEDGVISNEHIALLTPEIEQKIFAIATTDVDEVERKITNHDVRAWVQIAREILPEPLRRWVHVPLTSYDAIDTARTIQFVRAHHTVVRPLTIKVMTLFIDKVHTYHDTIQIGRTHLQHALPITVGFWFAGILSRVHYCIELADKACSHLVGKISGAVGAYNAQDGLGITKKSYGDLTFEERVLAKLNLSPARISTQILPPEPLANYLHACVLLSAALGQFGRDGRRLMATEIDEITEPFDKGQVGSSTMAHKRNPINFENLEGTWLKVKNEFGKVLDTLLTDHQRDLVASSVYRDFPTIITDVVLQLNTLLRSKGDKPPFLARIAVNEKACERNFAMQGDFILAEPMYIALQMADFPDDAHKLINEVALPKAKEKNWSLFYTVKGLMMNSREHTEAWLRIPAETLELFEDPKRYTGLASEKALQIARIAMSYCEREKLK